MAETMATDAPVTGGSGMQREVPVERRREPRMRTSGEVQELVSAVKELTEVVKEGFKKIEGGKLPPKNSKYGSHRKD